ncbi:MAG: PilZ domain-containing protein [Sphingomonadales bacterium]|nr:PilZ domain-containing protein [Sphingomonadales bacterium]
MWPNSMVDKVVYVRAPSRVAWDLPIRYRQGSKRVSLMLHNLTPRGARVEGLESMQVGDMAMVQLPTLAPKAARVVWTRGDSAGIEFERPLHPDVFESIVNDHAEARIRTIADLEPEPDERPNFNAA